MGGREVVVFDGIARTEHLGVFETRNLAHGAELYIFRKARAESVDIDFTCVPTFRLYENLVTVLVGKTVDFVFDARAISRPQTPQPPIEHGRAVEALAQQIMHLCGCVGDVARDLLGDGVVGEVAEAAGVGVSGLLCHFGIIQ